MAIEGLENFLNELTSGKSEVKFEASLGSDLGLSSHIPFGIPSRIPQLDLAIARPGLPAGRIVEVYGFEGCLAAETKIPYQMFDPHKNLMCPKIDTIEELYKKFHDKDNRSYFTTYCTSSIGTIITNQISDVMDSGVKSCFFVRTRSGRSIIATNDHRFAVSPKDFVRLKDLRAGDYVLVNRGAKTARRDRIEEIRAVGVRNTYDIEMEHPIHNFIANDFVVHNSGKSCLALASVASVQHKGGYAVWLDAEHCWDPRWVAKNGVDPDRVIVINADSIESMFSVQQKVIDSYKNIEEELPVVLVTDSITAVPSAESLDKGYMEVQRIGTDARAIRTGMRKIANEFAESNILGIFINHNIAKTAATPFAKQSQSAGGHALKFYSSVRLEMARTKTLTEGDGDKKRRLGMEVAISVEKNKISETGPPRVKANLLNNGFSLPDNLFEALMTIEQIKKVNSQTFMFVPTEMQFKRREWAGFVAEKGEAEMYDWFINKAVATGFMENY